jgi:DNA-binding protein YbaB
MQSLHDQFPGAIEFYLYCMDDGVRAYHLTGKNKGDFTPTSFETSDDRLEIQRFRKLKKEVYWGDLDDLPLRVDTERKTKKSIQQLSIQDEIEQNVLILRVPGLLDDAFDVFIIRFANSFSNFYIPSDRNALSSELKQSLGKTIRGQLSWLYQLVEQQSKNVQRIQKAYLRSSDEMQQLKEQLEQEKASSQQLLEKYVYGLIQAQGKQLQCEVEVQEHFVEYLKQTQIPIEALEQVIYNALKTAYDLAIDPGHIRLTTNLIDTTATTRSAVSPKKSTQLVELDKTKTLLSRYEQAARQLEAERMKINGKNLASALGISGPAITDAIKKHRTKIQRLMEKYPQEWTLISDYIRPLREIKETIGRAV